MNIGQRVKLVKIHHMMNPILKEKLGEDGTVILIGKHFSTGKVVVKFDKTDVNYGEWWVGERYLETISVELVVGEFYWVSIDGELTVGEYIGDSLFDAVGYEWNFELKNIKVYEHIKKPIK